MSESWYFLFNSYDESVNQKWNGDVNFETACGALRQLLRAARDENRAASNHRQLRNPTANSGACGPKHFPIHAVQGKHCRRQTAFVKRGYLGRSCLQRRGKNNHSSLYKIRGRYGIRNCHGNQTANWKPVLPITAEYA